MSAPAAGFDFIQRIQEILATGDPAQYEDALTLAAQLPGPSGVEDRELAATLFAVAFHAEATGDYQRCADLYSKVVACKVSDPNVVAGAWFRLGLCHERRTSYRPARDAFEAAVRTAVDWSHMTGLAHWHLAELLVAAEEYGEALRHLDSILAMAPHPELSLRLVRWRRAELLVSEGNGEAAEAELHLLIQEQPDDTIAAKVLRQLAELHDAGGRRDQALEYFRRMFAHQHASEDWKKAAARRIKAIGRSGLGQVRS